MNPNKAAFALGLAMKAGCVKSGEFVAKKAFDEGSAQLVILDMECSEATKKRWIGLCTHKRCDYAEMEAPGRAIGKPEKMILCITSRNFAEMIKREHDKTQG